MSQGPYFENNFSDIIFLSFMTKPWAFGYFLSYMYDIFKFINTIENNIKILEKSSRFFNDIILIFFIFALILA